MSRIEYVYGVGGLSASPMDRAEKEDAQERMRTLAMWMKQTSALDALRSLASKVHDYDQLGPVNESRFGEIEADLRDIIAGLSR